MKLSNFFDIKYLAYGILILTAWFSMKLILSNETTGFGNTLESNNSGVSNGRVTEAQVPPKTSSLSTSPNNETNILRPSNNAISAAQSFQELSNIDSEELDEAERNQDNGEIFYFDEKDKISASDIKKLQARSIEYEADLLISLNDEEGYTPGVYAQLAEWEEKFGSNSSYQNEVAQDLEKAFGNVIDYSIPEDQGKIDKIFSEIEQQLAPYDQ